MKWLRTHLILALEVFYFNTLGNATAHSVHPISDGGLRQFQSIWKRFMPNIIGKPRRGSQLAKIYKSMDLI